MFCGHFSKSNCIAEGDCRLLWCASCLRTQMQADERAYEAEIKSLRRQLNTALMAFRRLARASRRPRKGVA